MMRPRFRFSLTTPYLRGLIVVALLALAALACDLTFSTAHFENAKLYKEPDSQTVARVFGPDEAIYCRAQLKNASSDSAIKAIWIAQPNTIVLAEELTAGNGDIALEATPPDGGWAIGDYRLELYLNGDRVQTIEFQVH